MLNSFKDYLFGLLPPYFKRNDSYKNENNQGLLERYLQIFGMELDDEITPFIENLLDIVDTQICDDKYLPLISGILGYIPSFALTTYYRKILAYAIAIYKCKGTIVSYKILFNILGYQVTIVEEIPKRKVTYDRGFIYDQVIPEKYDMECQRCANYFILIYPNDNPPTFEITPDLLNLVIRVTNFLQPINSKFKGLYIQGLQEGLLTEDEALFGAELPEGFDDTDFYIVSG